MFTALDHCHEAIEITSDDHVIQVWEEALCIINTKKEHFMFYLSLYLKNITIIFTYLHHFLKKGKKSMYEMTTDKLKNWLSKREQSYFMIYYF